MDKAAGEQSSAQPVETVLRQDRVVSPNLLDLIAGESALQYRTVNRRKEGCDRVGDFARRTVLDPLLGAVDRAGHTQQRLGIALQPVAGRHECSVGGAAADT